MKSAYAHLKDTLLNEKQGEQNEDYDYRRLNRERLTIWRREPLAVVEIERPTNLASARRLGYKAKEGVTLARIRIRKGRGVHSKPTGGRKPKKYGRVKKTRVKSIQSMAEERVARNFPNLEVLNSYWVGEDGQYKYYEVILLDPFHPAVANDKDLAWITNPANRGRVHRGLTSSGRKSRGFRYKGRGVEKARPSVRSNKRMQR